LQKTKDNRSSDQCVFLIELHPEEGTVGLEPTTTA